MRRPALLPRFTSSLPLLLGLGLGLGLAFGACGGRKVRQPPDVFLPDAPIDTGDPKIDGRAARAREIAELTSADIQALRKSLAAVGSAEHVETLVLHELGSGDVDGALDLLAKWAVATQYSEDAMASHLDLAIGAEQYEDCIAASDQYLVVHEDHPFLMLIRGYCLEHYGRPRAAAEMYYGGMGGIETIGGFTGVMERELGLTKSLTDLPPLAVHNDRVALLEYMTRYNVLGHVVMRHVTGLSVEAAPPDPRLIDLGGITTTEVDRIFTSRRDAFRHCQLLSKHRRKIPGGRLVLHLTIRRDGSPGNVERVRDTFEVQEIPACIEEQISHLWFPPPRYGKAVITEQDFRMLGD